MTDPQLTKERLEQLNRRNEEAHPTSSIRQHSIPINSSEEVHLSELSEANNTPNNQTDTNQLMPNFPDVPTSHPLEEITEQDLWQESTDAPNIIVTQPSDTPQEESTESETQSEEQPKQLSEEQPQEQPNQLPEEEPNELNQLKPDEANLPFWENETIFVPALIGLAGIMIGIGYFLNK